MPPDPLRRGVIGGAGALVIYALQFGIGIGVQVQLGRLLGPAVFGGFAVAVVCLNLVVTLGYVHADRYAIAQSDDFAAALACGISLELLWTALLVTAGVGSAFLLPRFGFDASLVLPTQILLFGAFLAPMSRIRATLEKQLSFAAARLPSLVAQAAGGVVGLAAAVAWGGVPALIAWKLSVLTLEAAGLWWVSPVRIRPRLDPALARRIVRFGAPLMGAAVLAYAYSNADYYVVGALLSSEDLGEYFFAFQATAFALAFRSVLNAVLLPMWANDRSRGDDAILRSYPVVACAMTVIYMVPTTILFAFSSEVVSLLFGAEWTRLDRLLPPLMLLTAMRAVGALWDPIVMVGNVTPVLLRVTLIRVVLAPALIVVGVFLAGLLGAAVGALVAYAITMPIVAYGVGRRYSLSYERPLILWLAYVLALGLIGLVTAAELTVWARLGAVLLANSTGLVALWRWFPYEFQRLGTLNGR
ncbi:MAG: oligosaccharide flippase family protein [Candidatus Nanopelagicales bacterium]